MRRGERPFSATKYACLSEEYAAKHMLLQGYCQVSRAFGHVSRVDVSDEELLVRVGREMELGRSVHGTAEKWYDFYRRCVSRDVITDVPEPVMFMIRNPGEKFVLRLPGPSDEEFVAMIVELGLV